MDDHLLEAQFEIQIEELKDRLNECPRSSEDAEALMVRGILEGLIRGYQEQLSAMRQLRLVRTLCDRPARGGRT